MKKPPFGKLVLPNYGTLTTPLNEKLRSLEHTIPVCCRRKVFHATRDTTGCDVARTILMSFMDRSQYRRQDVGNCERNGGDIEWRWRQSLSKPVFATVYPQHQGTGLPPYRLPTRDPLSSSHTGVLYPMVNHEPYT